ncbi:DNA gyrase/topoisomerase IV subunit A [Myxosarcina sp. GI1(2024)]
MAKQLNLLGTGQIIPTPLHREMERSYLEYAMSVIVGRALPDVRDGLKPVHRRILYAMYELGLTPDRPYRKCARVVGDVLGKYHPHGDQSVYDALVRLVQSFATRYPLLDGHGNFGSIDNDPPAAMRYTETRLAPIAYQGMLDEISEATVDFSDNFDSSQQEPVVLPAQLPILLLNGCAGIAVGMATNIPPHNLSETVDGLIALIDRPDISDEKLWQLIPGPDFPTGGEIVETKGIQDAYLTGKGIIKVRGVAKAETLTSGKKRRREKQAIVVTELPYQVNKAGWIEKVADLVNQGRIEGISDIRDESDRQGLRVVIELKRETKHKQVLQQLYRQTTLQTNFGAILLALVNNQPVQLSLRQLLTEFLNFREQTLTRQYSHELAAAERRLHLVEGLLIALNNLDRVIDILRNAPDGTTAKFRLEEELGISPEQGDSILAMPMRRLTGLERQKLETEAEELQASIAQLNKVLGDRHELLKALKKELRALKRKFGDDRRTRIVNVSPTAEKKIVAAKSSDSSTKTENRPESEEHNKLMMFERSANAKIKITHRGCVYWQNPSEKAQTSNLTVKAGADFVTHREPIGERQKLIVVTDSGKAYPIAIEDIPSAFETTNQTAVELLSPAAQRDAKRTLAHFFLPEDTSGLDLVMLTEKGIIKRLPASELEALGNRGLVLIKLKERDRLKYFCFTRETEEVAIATTGGRILRLPVDEAQIPTMGRSAQGNKAIRLRVREKLAGCCAVTNQETIVLVSQLGYVKGLPVNTLRLANRGDIGTQAIQFAEERDVLVGAISHQSLDNLVIITDRERRLTFPVSEIPLLDKNSTGEKLIKLSTEEVVIAIAPGIE